MVTVRLVQQQQKIIMEYLFRDDVTGNLFNNNTITNNSRNGIEFNGNQTIMMLQTYIYGNTGALAPTPNLKVQGLLFKERLPKYNSTDNKYWIMLPSRQLEQGF